MTKRFRLVLTKSVLLLTPSSVLASDCVTLPSINDPSRSGISCETDARSSTNGSGIWPCYLDAVSQGVVNPPFSAPIQQDLPANT